MEITNDTIREPVQSPSSDNGLNRNAPSSQGFPRYRLFLPHYCALDKDTAADIVIDAAERRQSFGVTHLAVHGLIESLSSESLGAKINRIQMIVPDGQPIVWALNSFYKLGMRDKVSLSLIHI